MGEVGGLDWIGLDWPGYRGQRVKCQIQIKESEKQLEQQEQRDGWMAVDVKKKEKKKLFLPLSINDAFIPNNWLAIVLFPSHQREASQINCCCGRKRS